tara:strand:+ start:442 stop:711 length:270 start_codon:yes stop_codon:yes gene_type:complete
MHDISLSDNDPDYEPSQTSEDEMCHADCEGCDECCDYDEEHFFEGTDEDAVLSGLMTFVMNRTQLLPHHIPLYKELLRSLLDEANERYC